MWVTLYTDASYNAEGGGWGIWAKSERGRIVNSGVCPKEEVTEALLAEMWAIKEGVAAILREWGSEVEGVSTKTDCQGAISALKYGAKSHRRLDIRHIQVLVKDLLAPDTKMKMRWVKGHQKEATTQAWLNNRVDALSREHRRGK